MKELMESLQILILEQETNVIEQLFCYLSRQGFSIFCAKLPGLAFQILENNKIDVVLCDTILTNMTGIEALKKIKSDFPSTEVIMLGGCGSFKTVMEAIHLGAVDFLRKPFTTTDVLIAIERSHKYLILQNRLKLLENQKSLISRDLENRIERELIGESEAIKNALNLALKAADDQEINVLIEGENGTGKEIIARIIHYASELHDHVFFPMNSAAIPETLLESEFFGHRKGSFTGAIEDKKGCFELARGGTLFLDEIADMPLSLQSKLLRAIEEKKIKQIGSNREISVDVRIISATNKNISKLVEEKKFRIDLYHRINALIIKLPPLRERPEDIEPIFSYYVNYFAKKKKKPIPQIASSIIKKLEQYHFPGNVRELKNLVERAMIMLDGDVLDERYFPCKEKRKDSLRTQRRTNYNLEQNEINLLKEVLEICGNNKTKSAELLGIPRYTLIRKLKKYFID